MKFRFLKKRKTVLVVVILAIVLVIVFAITRGQSSTKQKVVSEIVKTDNISLLISASGNILPKSSYSLTPKVTTKAIEIKVKVGDKVKKGDILVKFDDTELQNAAKIAMYNFNSAIYKREQLKNATIVDQYLVDQAQQQINVTYTQLQSARNNVNNATITAPIDGEILTLNIKLDEYPSMTLPAIIVADTSVFEAVIGINEIDVNKVEIGHAARLTIDAIGKTVDGIVSFVDVNGVNTAGIITYQVRITPNDITSLKSNMTVDADIIISEHNNVIVVPAAAIQQKVGKYYVKTVPSETSDVSLAVEKEVEIGISNNAVTEIKSGLNVGEYVIINIINDGGSSIFNFGSSK